MTAKSRHYFDLAFLQLEKIGFLLQSDSFLPSLRTVVAGNGSKGSWWASEEAQTIFEVSEMLDEHPDVMVMKLITGKVTFVHRELWGRVYSIGVAREEWQMKTLTPAAKQLLKTLEAEGTLQTSKLNRSFGDKPSETARQLEMKLLIKAEQIHTSSGAHATILETWPTWASRVGFRVRPKSPAAARRSLEERISKVETPFPPDKPFPWSGKVK